MPNLKPYRDYSEHDVINLFATDTVPLVKGTFVKIASGVNFDDETNAMIGHVGASYAGVTSQRYGVVPKVAVASSGLRPLGMTLWDVREVDENGELLKFNPKKAAEMQAVISGQAIPIVTRGTFLYSGAAGTIPNTGGAAYINDAATDGSLSPSGTASVGRFLGPKDAAGWVLLKIEL